jgi:hypothetical protein
MSETGGTTGVGTSMSSIRVARSRLSWPVLVLAGVGLVASAADAADELAQSLVGTWRGTLSGKTAQTSQGEVEVELKASGRGVVARWPALDGTAQSAELVPGKRPDVLAPAAGGFQAMLGNTKVPNTLEGEPLLWGRRDGQGFYIYRLELAADGSLALDRYAFEPGADGGRMSFGISRTGAGGESLGEARAELERQDR